MEHAQERLLTSVQYLEKRVLIQLNGSRRVMGILRGYDVYLNIVLDEAVEEKPTGEKARIGMVVIRGNSVVMLEVCGLLCLASNSYSNSTT
jgi:small nuclear ribonucleoprotein G